MKSAIGVQIGAKHGEMLQSRVAAITQARTHGSHRLPQVVRDAQSQPAAGGVLLTWKLPPDSENVTGYRVYLDTESNLHVQIRDRGTRQLFIPLSTGAVAPPTNIFVSAVNGFREGPKLALQAKPLPDAASPGPNPLPPTGWRDEFSGGLDKTQSGRPSGARQP